MSPIANLKPKKLKLRGKAMVFIDWANVYGWRKTLKRDLDPEKLFKYLKNYPDIVDIRFYFGEDEHPKSRAFLKKVEEIGYTVITKPVKHILIVEIDGKNIYRRKCDFDMETCIDVHEVLVEDVESFIFFTGDGDYAPLYQKLIKLGKQVIVIYMYYHLGREIFGIKKGVYKVSIVTLEKWDESLFS